MKHNPEMDQVPPEDSQNAPAPPPNGRKRRKLSPLVILLDVLIVIVAGAGIFLLLRGWLNHRKQDQLTEQLRQVGLGTYATLVVNVDDIPMDGIDGGYDDLETEDDLHGGLPTLATSQNTGNQQSGMTSGTNAANGTAANGTAPTSASAVIPADTATPASPPAATPTPAPGSGQQVVIAPIGRIILPKIKVDMPIAEGATTYTLSMAIGRYSPSAGLGQPGLTILLGHRMYSYGRHFNRLGEMAVNDQIIIEDQHNRYIYQVDRIDRILPSEMGREFRATVEGSRIMLVTCDPIRVASHRLLVKGNLIQTIPLSEVS